MSLIAAANAPAVVYNANVFRWEDKRQAQQAVGIDCHETAKATELSNIFEHRKGEPGSGSDAADSEQKSPCCFPKGRNVRERIYTLFDDPSTSILARVISVFVLVAILVSTLAFIIETLPSLRESDERIWLGIEISAIIVFTLEYGIRLITSPKKLAFIIVPLNVIDFVAIAPFYLELFIFLILGTSIDAGLQFLRVLRVARVFRIFKVGKYSSAMRIFGRAMKDALGGLYLLLFYLVIAVIIFSSIIFYAERGEWSESRGHYIREDGEESPFDSIPASMWWSIVTMTTVGYGDVVPITELGKFTGCLCMLLGILIIALPTSIIGHKFAEVYDLERKNQLWGSEEDGEGRMMQSPWEQERDDLREMFDNMQNMLAMMQDRVLFLDSQYQQQLTRNRALEEEKAELIRSQRDIVGAPRVAGSLKNLLKVKGAFRSSFDGSVVSSADRERRTKSTHKAHQQDQITKIPPPVIDIRM